MNIGKRAISLNLATEKGREIFKQLVQISDVVIENFSPRVMTNWGLDYEQLKKVNPRIIMVSISGLGHDGPLKDYYMYVPGMEGMSGLTHMTGYPDEEPLLSGCAYGDWVTGANAAMAMITALFLFIARSMCLPFSRSSITLTHTHREGTLLRAGMAGLFLANWIYLMFTL